MLPFPIIKKLGLKHIGISDYITASGESQTANVYIARLLLFDKEVDVAVLATDTNFALAGMGLFNKCRIVIEMSKNLVEVSQSTD